MRRVVFPESHRGTSVVQDEIAKKQSGSLLSGETRVSPVTVRGLATADLSIRYFRRGRNTPRRTLAPPLLPYTHTHTHTGERMQRARVASVTSAGSGYRAHSSSADGCFARAGCVIKSANPPVSLASPADERRAERESPAARNLSRRNLHLDVQRPIFNILIIAGSHGQP